MMGKKWQKIIKTMRDLFLNSQDENIETLIEDIKIIMNNMPIGQINMPYIGRLDDDYKFLEKFENFPSSIQDSSFILATVSKIFSGTLKWYHPNVMHNVIPSPMIGTVAAATISSLYNLNPIWDFTSAGTHQMERQTVRQLSREAGWDDSRSSGVSTFGGKGCIIYALRIGLNRCIKKVSSSGLSNQRKSPIVITSKENHYCINTAASLIGIGYENVWRAEVDEDETINISSFESLLRKAYEEDYPIAAIVVCGGNSLHLSIDDLRSVSSIIDDIVGEYKTDYKPYIYFDTCVGWPWMFFINYDFKINPLEIPKNVLGIVKEAANNIAAIKLADGFGVDFHKTGFCPYSTSIFLTKDGSELNSIFKDELLPFEEKKKGGNFLHHFTLEHSRSANSILSAWVAMQTMGRDGILSYICNQTLVACEIRNILPKYGIELLNPFSLTFASVFFPIPHNKNISYWDLMNQDHCTIKQYNEYTFRLFNYFQDIFKNKVDSFIFRFVPQYRKAKCDINLAVLVIFPMSIDLTVESARDIANRIGQIKLIFDTQKDITDITNLIPEHVIK
jgi:glutamate/tyrosine decarboxylase-like PLP-dependent enzyme